MWSDFFLKFNADLSKVHSNTAEYIFLKTNHFKKNQKLALDPLTEGILVLMNVGRENN